MSKNVGYGTGFRGIERIEGIHPTTLINWVKPVKENLSDTYPPEEIPEVGGLDELETFVGAKKQDLALDGD